MPRGEPIPWRDVHWFWLAVQRPRYPLPELGERFRARFGLEATNDAIANYCLRSGIRTGRDGRFRPGQQGGHRAAKGVRLSPRTEFKKGQRPPNTCPIGTHELVGSGGSGPYWMVKTREKLPGDPPPRGGWRYVHHMEWEREHGRPVPPDHVVLFVDADRDNVKPDNLAAVTRAALAMLNKLYGFATGSAEVRAAAIATASLRAEMARRRFGHVRAPDGVPGHLRRHAERYGMKYATVLQRVGRGASIEEALTRPLGERGARARRASARA